MGAVSRMAALTSPPPEMLPPALDETEPPPLGATAPPPEVSPPPGLDATSTPWALSAAAARARLRTSKWPASGLRVHVEPATRPHFLAIASSCSLGRLTPPLRTLRAT